MLSRSPLVPPPPSIGALRSDIAWTRVLAAADRFRDALDRCTWNPDQPRIPAGESGGGRWTDGTGGGATRDDRRSKDRIRLADASTTRSPELLADLKQKIDAADQRLANALARGSSGLEISHAEIDRARLSIAEKALERVGSTEWAHAAAKDNYGAGTYKCNLFVYDMLKEVEADPPLANGGWRYNWFGQGAPKYPVLAGQWADPKFDVPGWTVVADGPRLGDLLARAATSIFSIRATGHVGVFSGYEGMAGRTVSARDNSVVLEQWPFADRNPYTIRRYKGARSP
jgi:hypothetical protein